ncbi:hypothetical protein ACTWP5_27280 [Streptomyces sp. 4N509B]|uniref:hypothetical protein n=1 Tax=Streptomyces sp. 4N509B TaxID=3457413 RepID=UPI003FD11852
MSWDTLVKAFRYAAAPVNDRGGPDRRTTARVALSPVLVRAQGSAERVLETLCGVLNDRGGRCVAHARATVPPEAASPHDRVMPLSEVITPTLLRSGVVERTGRLRLPNYALLCDVVEWLSRTPAPETSLRDHCYARKRQRRPFLNWLWKLGNTPADGGALAFLWNVLGGLFQVAPQWRWTRGLTRHLLRSRRQRHGWYRSALGDSAPVFGIDFFDHVEEHVGELLADGGTHRGLVTQRQRELDRLLVHALLADLARWSRPSRVAPWRRRRVTRFVILLHLPEDGMGPGNRWEHFLQVCGSAVEATGCAAAMWVAVGPRDAEVRAVDTTPGDAAQMLRSRHGDIPDDIRPLRLSLPAGVEAPRPRPARRSIRPVPGPRAWVTGEAMAGVVALTLALWGTDLLFELGPEAERTCHGGSPPGDEGPAPRDPADMELPALYREAEEMIAEENARAEREAADGRAVRTIAYLGVPVTGDWIEGERQRSDGALPELRGVALAQRALNEEAQADRDKVWLRVVPYHFETYEEADDAARRIVADVREGRHAHELIGVVGVAQSWSGTQEAVTILDEAEIPTIVTNATADEMQVGAHLHQIAPPSSREAEVAGAFAREANIVEDTDGACAPAQAAIVVQSPHDLYSRSLGDSFAEDFRSAAGPGSVERLWHTPDADAPDDLPRDVTWEEDVHGVAESVCERIQQAEETPTIVYWAARAQQFRAFLSDMEDSTPCAGAPLTVVGGNGLSNPTLSGLWEGLPWLRLYHASHVLPAGQERSHIAEGFNADYAGEFGVDDPWRDDGHAALAYDTLQVMAEAANQVYRSTAARSVSRESVQVVLDQGVERTGASGHLDFPVGEPVSRDKPLVILHHTDSGPDPVLACGAFATYDVAERWGPDGAFDCPSDDD